MLSLPIDCQPCRPLPISSHRLRPPLSLKSIINILLGLGKIGIIWNTIVSGEDRNAIVDQIYRLLPIANAQDFSSLLYSTALFELPLDLLPRRIQQGLYSTFQRVSADLTPKDLANCLYSLSSSGVAWDDLPPGVHWSINCALRRVEAQLSHQHVPSLVYAVACLCFDSVQYGDPSFRGVHEVLVGAVRRLYGHLGRERAGGGGAQRGTESGDRTHRNVSSVRILDPEDRTVGRGELEQLCIFAYCCLHLDRVDSAATNRLPTFLFQAELNGYSPNHSSHVRPDYDARVEGGRVGEGRAIRRVEASRLPTSSRFQDDVVLELQRHVLALCEAEKEGGREDLSVMSFLNRLIF